MVDEYAYLRNQYLEIIEHCNYLLRSSADPATLTRANESKQQAQHDLARLNRNASHAVVRRS
jgi:hypothetical protein